MKILKKLLAINTVFLIIFAFSIDVQAQRRKGPPPKKAHKVAHAKHHPHHKYAHHPKRGAVVKVVPSGAAVVMHKGVKFHLHSGVWYKPKGGAFVVVRPVRGIRIKTLPPGHRKIVLRQKTYFYYYGTYYMMTNTKEYEVIDAPVGAEVDALPDGYTTETVDGKEYYKLDDTYYKQKDKGGETAYEVVEVK